MKQRVKILSIVLATFSIMAFSFVEWNKTGLEELETVPSSVIDLDKEEIVEPDEKTDIDLVYAIDSRYLATITKEDLLKARSILEIVPETAEEWRRATFQNVIVYSLEDDRKVSSIGEHWWEGIPFAPPVSESGEDASAFGNDKLLNPAQLELIKSFDYSTNFFIKALEGTKHPITYAYYFSVIPEKEAEYVDGSEALVTYLKERSKEKTAIITRDNLRPCQVSFTVTKNGTLENVRLTATSGYPSVDELMVELIDSLPAKWNPAENSEGEKVDQELVFFFGLMGC